MRIAFLGTPEFALPSLAMLIARGDTLCVFTQPDRPVGRKAVLTPPPVKALALEHGVLTHRNGDDQVARRTAVLAVAAHTAQCDPLAVVNARGDGDGQLFALAHATRAATLIAGVLDDLTRASTA